MSIFTIKRIIPLAFGMLYCLISCAEINRIWETATFTAPFNDKWFFQVAPQLRVRTKEVMFDQFLNNSGIGYMITPRVRLLIGNTNMINESLARIKSNELRLFQQLRWFYPLTPKVNVEWRTRFEERHWQNFLQWNSRVRQRLFLRKDIKNALSVVVWNEFFVNFNNPIWLQEKTLGQNRFYLGLYQDASKHLTLGAGYLLQTLSNYHIRSNHALAFDIFYDLTTIS